MATRTRLRLGTITCPSGRLVIVDTGYLGLWSGASPPAAGEAVLAGIEDPALRESIRRSADLTITGPDAEAAARSFDRQPGVWLYDIPEHGVAPITAAFDEHCREHRLDARLEPRTPRVSHRERVERCVRAGGQEFLMNGVAVVAIGGLPTGRELAVTATQRDFGRIGPRWESIAVELGPEAAASSRLLGHVGVDAARISLADADGLSAWRHEEPLDGLADVAFWGRSVQDAAAHFGASPLGTPGEDGTYGWPDLPVDDAADRARALGEWKQAAPGRALMVDFRPHSHHWQVMARVRATEHGAGVIEVGGTHAMCLGTGWGDGFFPVHADHDADGSLARIRITLGDDERQARMETMYDQWNLD